MSAESTNWIHPQLEFLAVDIDSLVPDPENPRKHGDRNVQSVKASLEKYGQRKPLVVQKDGRIIRKGNNTWAAAKALGWTKIAAVVVDDPDLVARAYSVDDNRAGELADFDEAVLSVYFKILDPLDICGFDEAEMQAIIDGEPISDQGRESGSRKPGDPEEATQTIKVEAVKAKDKDQLQDAINLMLTDSGYGYDCKAF